MAKYPRYQDYVIKDGQLVGEFEQMYQDYEDPWEQSKYEYDATDKAICLNFIRKLNVSSVLEFGCGLGQLTSEIAKVAPRSLGVDVSETAVKKAKQRHPECNFAVSTFPDLTLISTFRPDCIVMAELTWYVLDYLNEFTEFIRSELPDTYLLHFLTTYPEGTQKYGLEKFSNLDELKSYFGMNYLESGEIYPSGHGGIKRTYFVGRYAKT